MKKLDLIFSELESLEKGLASVVEIPKVKVEQIKKVAVKTFTKYKDKFMDGAYYCWLTIRENKIVFRIKEYNTGVGCGGQALGIGRDIYSINI